jgi:hypothetical protein
MRSTRLPNAFPSFIPFFLMLVIIIYNRHTKL